MSHACAQDKAPWRTLLSSKVGLIFVVTFLCVALSLSSAQSQDVTPPTLTAFSFTPTTLDTSAGPANVAVSFSATDNLSGIVNVRTDFESPSGTQLHSATSTFSPPTTSGSATVGATFPQFSEAGTWKVLQVVLTDAAQNFRGYRTTELAQLGFPTQLVVGATLVPVPGNGFTPSAPAATVFQGDLALFVQGEDNRIYVNWLFPNNQWTGWSAVPGGGSTSSAPAATVFQGDLALFVQGEDNRIYMNFTLTGP
jgi:hypothetical protein